MLGLFWAKGPVTPPTADTPVQDLLTDPAFLMFFGLMLLHCLFYVPTISITNSIAFANLKDPQKEFGPVRLWGTIGWIAAAWPFVFILLDWADIPSMADTGFIDWWGEALGRPLKGSAYREGTALTFVVAGVASLVLAAFSLSLPHTPPRPAAPGGESLAWLEAVKLLKKPFILVLFIVTFIDAAVHQYFFAWAERYLTGGAEEFPTSGVRIPSNFGTAVMSIGQVAEIATMAFLGYVLKRLGWRWTMVIGILGHAGRFAVFAFLPHPALAIAVNVLHGICYAFFFATVYIFVDEYLPKDARSSAQGLFNALILGIGPLTTNLISPYLGAAYMLYESEDKKVAYFDFQAIFIIPLAAALIGAVLLLVLFHPPPKEEAARPGGLERGAGGGLHPRAAYQGL